MGLFDIFFHSSKKGQDKPINYCFNVLNTICYIGCSPVVSAIKKETISEKAESTHLEAATSEEKPKKKGFFERLFG